MAVCVICEQKVDGWRPDPRRGEYSPILRVLDVVGPDADNHLCPSCGADDRERHAWLYLAASGVLDESAHRRALHIGPEPRLRERFSRLPVEWTFVEAEELESGLSGHDASRYHLVVCNRVLPAVADVDATIGSIARCLADDGWLVAQSTYTPMLKRTLAFTVPPTEKAAHLFFGDDRHLRLFGADLVEAFAAAGLRGGPYRHEDVLPGMDGAIWGCNPREPFFLFSRHRCLTSPS